MQRLVQCAAFAVCCGTLTGAAGSDGWTCQVGQGGKSSKDADIIAKSSDNSETKCGDTCAGTSGCIAFDITTKSKDDACRLFDDKVARLGDGGKDSRQYCSMALEPTPAPPPTPLPPPTPPPKPGLDVAVAADGSYTVLVDGTPWFASAAPSFRHGGRVFTQEDGSLQPLHAPRGGAQTWATAPGGVRFDTSVKVYDGYAVFTQSFPDGAANTSAGDRDKLASAYPVLLPRWAGAKGVVSFQGDMTGDGTTSGGWDGVSGLWHGAPPASAPLGSNSAPIGGGIKNTGAVAVFDEDLRRTLVLSPFSNFMAANQVYDSKAGSLSYGVMGGVTEIPKGYSISTVIALGSGVNSAMDTWGDVLLTHYGKERYAYKRDLAIQYLGYSTDNGAYYYYVTEPNKNYEETLVDVLAYAAQEKLPYKYVLLDSWWYFKGEGSGVKTWDARPDIFPDGLSGFYEKTNHWPQQNHNRMWSPDTTYAKQNGGQYNFIMDGSAVTVPDDQALWDDLMLNKSKTGMFMYEQDWLHTEFDKSKSLGENATLGRTWMMQMNAGAVKANQTIQMCMSYVRHVLQSVEMPAVTNSRASGDYHPGKDQWSVLGTTSILAHAVGIGPSKDNYWSTEVQDSPKYGKGVKEPHSRLQSAVSTLTNGPVAPSDKVNASNATLIMRCCSADGRLLSADRPATEIDAYFVHSAFGGGVDGHLWSTYATVSGLRFGYAFGVKLNSPYNLTAAEMGYGPAARLAAAASGGGQQARQFGAGAPLQLAACGEDDFQLFLLAPYTGAYALLGEPDKWISVSPQRFASLSATGGGGATVAVSGAGGERVTVRWADAAGAVVSSVCTLPASGAAVATVSAAGAECR